MRIFVANIGLTMTEDALRQLFAPYGEVERAQIITDRDTGRSRGYGFVEMANATQAQAAMAGLQGTTVGDRTLTVEEARPRDRRRPRGDGPRVPRWEGAREGLLRRVEQGRSGVTDAAPPAPRRE
jgi:RNA recognition motif-containing protein